ncbi:25S rRNA (cytosine-C(5))-methyltransferase nop2 [Zancudomyces culisetae]|uniref:25S rRNA (Cytosine-C(5))-methyltransferase nop2 n=1 Tax=Zancudomyces culisetae TaxID=1213189 RepID=A0A1R1PNS7_ZANCU|nr:25S rRNA (cytosine-C(5))-methyltransferase nop2 [Zancudomyces culisetae]|eukprot:OMH82626.1 25S rRNA (cytosine-C(5))-methyltransferase nop2 [Zancudomyces culisetae]
MGRRSKNKQGSILPLEIEKVVGKNTEVLRRKIETAAYKKVKQNKGVRLEKKNEKEMFEDSDDVGSEQEEEEEEESNDSEEGEDEEEEESSQEESESENEDIDVEEGRKTKKMRFDLEEGDEDEEEEEEEEEDSEDDEDEYSDSDSDSEQITWKNMEKKSKKMEKIEGQIQEDAEKELKEGADNMPEVDRVLELGEETDLRSTQHRIQEIITVLNNFQKLREEGKTRADYLEQLKKDIMVVYGYNEYLANKVIEQFRIDEVIEFLEANEASRPLTIRVNTVKAKRKEVAERLIKKGVNLDVFGGKWNKVGLSIFESSIPIGATMEYMAGMYMIQAASSFLPVLALDPQPNDRVLDMSAAPGGKTTFISAMLQNTGLVVANDASKSRLKSLVANIHRLGITNTIVTNLDGRELKRILPHGFDRVLLDAPCSGTGVIAKDNSIKASKSQVDIDKLAHLQRELLLSALESAKSPGGTVVYSTCSFTVEEDEAVVDYILKKLKKKVRLVQPDALADVGVPGFVSYREHNHPSRTLLYLYKSKNSTKSNRFCNFTTINCKMSDKPAEKQREVEQGQEQEQEQKQEQELAQQPVQQSRVANKNLIPPELQTEEDKKRREEIAQRMKRRRHLTEEEVHAVNEFESIGISAAFFCATIAAYFLNQDITAGFVFIYTKVEEYIYTYSKFDYNLIIQFVAYTFFIRGIFSVYIFRPLIRKFSTVASGEGENPNFSLMLQNCLTEIIWQLFSKLAFVVAGAYILFTQYPLSFDSFDDIFASSNFSQYEFHLFVKIYMIAYIAYTLTRILTISSPKQIYSTVTYVQLGVSLVLSAYFYLSGNFVFGIIFLINLDLSEIVTSFASILIILNFKVPAVLSYGVSLVVLIISRVACIGTLTNKFVPKLSSIAPFYESSIFFTDDTYFGYFVVALFLSNSLLALFQLFNHIMVVFEFDFGTNTPANQNKNLGFVVSVPREKLKTD